MRSSWLLIAALVLAGCAQQTPKLVLPGPAKIELVQTNGWRLRVNGVDFPIRGAGGAEAPGLLEQLKAAGGNTVRTWGIETLELNVADGERFIDRAHQLGIMVVPGIWIEHERHGFDYSKPEFIHSQRTKVLAAIRQYKNHPAVLAWGLGNEMEDPISPGGSIAVFKEVEELTRLVKAEDPRHPVMSVIAFNEAKVANVLRYVPSLDILGVNAYGAATGVGEALQRAGWTKPFAVTEFGPPGPWEVPLAAWGAPLEPTSQEKARMYFATHRLVLETNDGKELGLGMFAFLWGWKQESTSTWFGMFLPTLEKLPQVDAMTMAWTGQWPKNRSPDIRNLTSAAAGQVVKPDQRLTASLQVTDPEGDALTYRWSVVAESVAGSVGGDAESAPPSYPELIQKNGSPECAFRSPRNAGNYRLFVTVHDNKGSAATANFPFRVEP